jgi:hypothetical protein
LADIRSAPLVYFHFHFYGNGRGNVESFKVNLWGACSQGGGRKDGGLCVVKYVSKPIEYWATAHSEHLSCDKKYYKHLAHTNECRKQALFVFVFCTYFS